MASVSAFCYTKAQPVDILKIATFNINGIRSRLPALLEWLEREGPDVVCLQELKAPDAAFPINDIHAARLRSHRRIREARSFGPGELEVEEVCLSIFTMFARSTISQKTKRTCCDYKGC